MRVLGLIVGGGVIIFWTFMNLLLIQRVLDYRSLDQYHRGVIDFLGQRDRRERSMGIFQKGQRIGSTRFAMEKDLGMDQVGYHISFSTVLTIDILGQGGNLSFEGEASLDAKMVPRTLNARLSVGGARVRIDGQREGGRFVLALKTGEQVIFRQAFPLEEMLLSDGLVPSIPVAGLKVGQTYRVPIFDPLLKESSLAETEVLSSATRRAEGVNVDCLLLVTHFHGLVFRSWVTPDGEVLRQEVPPDLVLLPEPSPGEGRKR